MSDLTGLSLPGIPDRLFIRGDVPMTKEEIRVITLSKARLEPGMVVWDVGSGTGSISVEAARMTPGGKVYAVERSPEGCRLTSENCTRFSVDNVEVVAGSAPEALVRLPRPHRVFVGGTGGNMKAILEEIKVKLMPGGRLVINAVTLETITSALNFLKDGWETEIVQVSISKSQLMGASRLMKAYNPVFIIAAWGWS
ncbi:MAG: nucleotide-binding protein [Peptococcaceae bacterium BRH_c4a]|nr:MAG: nucleotide-binding protein [Peptococcaceae bacterium BRH_c4a]